MYDEEDEEHEERETLDDDDDTQGDDDDDVNDNEDEENDDEENDEGHENIEDHLKYAGDEVKLYKEDLFIINMILFKCIYLLDFKIFNYKDGLCDSSIKYSITFLQIFN